MSFCCFCSYLCLLSCDFLYTFKGLSSGKTMKFAFASQSHRIPAGSKGYFLEAFKYFETLQKESTPMYPPGILGILFHFG